MRNKEFDKSYRRIIYLRDHGAVLSHWEIRFAKLYEEAKNWYDQGYLDARMEMNEEKNDGRNH